MIRVALTDEEVTTILVALDNYSSMKDTDWVDSGCEDDELRAESSGAAHECPFIDEEILDSNQLINSLEMS